MFKMFRYLICILFISLVKADILQVLKSGTKVACDDIAIVSSVVSALQYIPSKCARIDAISRAADSYFVILDSLDKDAKEMNREIVQVKSNILVRALKALLKPIQDLLVVLDRIYSQIYNAVLPTLSTGINSIKPLKSAIDLLEKQCSSPLIRKYGDFINKGKRIYISWGVSAASAICGRITPLLGKRDIPNISLTEDQLVEFYRVFQPLLQSMKNIVLVGNNDVVDKMEGIMSNVETAWNNVEPQILSTRDTFSSVLQPIKDLTTSVMEPIKAELDKEICTTDILKSFYGPPSKTSCPDGYYLNFGNRCERRTDAIGFFSCPPDYAFDFIRWDCWQAIDSHCDPGLVPYLDLCYKRCPAGYRFRQIGTFVDYTICDPEPTCTKISTIIDIFVDTLDQVKGIILAPINAIVEPILNGIIGSININPLPGLSLPSFNLPYVPTADLFDIDNMDLICANVAMSTSILPEEILGGLRLACPSQANLIQSTSLPVQDNTEIILDTWHQIGNIQYKEIAGNNKYLYMISTDNRLKVLDINTNIILDSTDAIKVSVGNNNLYVVRGDGHLSTWTSEKGWYLVDTDKVSALKDIAVGNDLLCILDSSNTIWCKRISNGQYFRYSDGNVRSITIDPENDTLYCIPTDDNGKIYKYIGDGTNSKWAIVPSGGYVTKISVLNNEILVASNNGKDLYQLCTQDLVSKNVCTSSELNSFKHLGYAYGVVKTSNANYAINDSGLFQCKYPCLGN